MKAIVTHERPDFDALASLALARLLHPDHVVVLGDSVPREVREVVARYRDEIDPVTVERALDLGLTDVVMVDTSDPGRTGRLADAVRSADRTVYDHHVAGDPARRHAAGAGLVDAVGATVTLLVRELDRRGIDPSPALCSLALLGLHADTGNFTFDSTTPEDLAAAGWLMRHGGTLDLVRQHCMQEDAPERTAFRDAVLAAARDVWIAGRRVAFATVRWPEYVAGASSAASDLLATADHDAAVVVAAMADRTMAFARARGSAFDVAAALTAACGGGGGHPGAAFARWGDGGDVDAAAASIQAALADHAAPVVTARDLMSSPVRTVSSGTSVLDAAATLSRYGHNGAPVERDGRIVGVVSRRDLERALHHDLGHTVVDGVMGAPAITVGPDATLDALERTVIATGIGRLPITIDGRVVGIVTRSDLLAARHRPAVDVGEGGGEGSGDAAAKIVARVDHQAGGVLSALRAALPRGGSAYLIGGTVRDALLGTTVTDVDVVVENASAGEVVTRMQASLGGEAVRHDAFGTASLRLDGGLDVDVATAREERYAAAGDLPVVETSDVRRDLARRDFTVNAVAVRIAPPPEQVIDPFGGVHDLREARLRTLHPLSFDEDPTRIVRGARLATRLRLAFTPDVEEQIHRAARRTGSGNVSVERLRSELDLVVGAQDAGATLALLQRLGAWTFLYGLPAATSTWHHLDALRRDGRDVPGVSYVVACLVMLPPEQVLEQVERWRFPHALASTVERVRAASSGEGSVGEAQFEAMGRAGRAVLETSSDALRDDVRAFEAVQGRRRVLGRDLLELGMVPGPAVGALLAQIDEARRLREVLDYDQERALAARLVHAWQRERQGDLS